MMESKREASVTNVYKRDTECNERPLGFKLGQKEKISSFPISRGQSVPPAEHSLGTVLWRTSERSLSPRHGPSSQQDSWERRKAARLRAGHSPGLVEFVLPSSREIRAARGDEMRASRASPFLSCCISRLTSLAADPWRNGSAGVPDKDRFLPCSDSACSQQTLDDVIYVTCLPFSH